MECLWKFKDRRRWRPSPSALLMKGFLHCSLLLAGSQTSRGSSVSAPMWAQEYWDYWCAPRFYWLSVASEDLNFSPQTYVEGVLLIAPSPQLWQLLSFHYTYAPTSPSLLSYPIGWIFLAQKCTKDLIPSDWPNAYFTWILPRERANREHLRADAKSLQVARSEDEVPESPNFLPSRGKSSKSIPQNNR